MFERPGKSSLQKKTAHGFTTLVPPMQLLLKNKRPEQIKIIEESAQFSATRFKTLCEPLLTTLLRYTQQLPDTTNYYFSHPGGAFDHALSRTRAASELFHNSLLSDPAARLSNIQQCFWYALFSAGLLKGIGKLPLDYQVKLYNEQHKQIKIWEPLLEALYGTAKSYQFEFINSTYDETYRQRLNIILAQQLMPKAGLTWLMQHPQVFEIWLALLHEDAASAGALGLILDRADAIAIQEDLFNAVKDFNYPKQKKTHLSTFIDSGHDETIGREKVIGTEFLKWLLNKIESGKFTFNKPPLLSVAGGTLIGPEAFKLFANESVLFKNWVAVKNSFLSLGIHDKSYSTAQTQGVLVKGSLALPNTVHHQATKTGSPRETNVMDAQSPDVRKQLTEKGEWQAITENAPASFIARRMQ